MCCFASHAHGHLRPRLPHGASDVRCGVAQQPIVSRVESVIPRLHVELLHERRHRSDRSLGVECLRRLLAGLGNALVPALLPTTTTQSCAPRWKNGLRCSAQQCFSVVPWVLTVSAAASSSRWTSRAILFCSSSSSLKTSSNAPPTTTMGRPSTKIPHSMQHAPHRQHRPVAVNEKLGRYRR